MKRLIRKMLLRIALYVCTSFYKFFFSLSERIEKKLNLQNFTKKYDREDLACMALSIPRGTPLHIADVQPMFPGMSKNKIYEVINFRKKINSHGKKTSEFFSIHMREIMEDLA